MTTLSESLRSQMSLPVVAAPMFLVSGPDLAIASCANGIMGTLTMNHCRDVEELDGQLRHVRQSLASIADADPGRRIGPLAVNTSLGLDRETSAGMLAACAAHGVSVIISANGDPRDFARQVHDAGMSIIHDVTSIRFAEKAIAADVDGVVAIGAGGGGHSGTVSALAFIPILRTMYDGLIVLAGSVSTGAVVRAAEVLGADLAYVGTRLIASQESMAPEAYKQMLVDERAENLMYTPLVNGVSANWMKASLRHVGLDPDALPVPERRGSDHLPDGVRPWRDIWSAGQGVSLIEDVPSVEAIVDRLRREYVAACETPDMRVSAELAVVP